MRMSLDDPATPLIEATCSQTNHQGVYTGRKACNAACNL